MLFYPPPHVWFLGGVEIPSIDCLLRQAFSFYELAAVDLGIGLSKYDKWWNLLICGFGVD
jgi:hypothetical protein